jgi:hypothetical protein
MANAALSTLAHYLIGEFENAAQAAAEPVWYVHLKLWQRLVPGLSSDQVHTLFLEQASVVANKPPYRQRILQLSERSNQLYARYFALCAPAKFVGAGAEPQRLEELSAADLVSLPNSEAPIQYQLQYQRLGNKERNTSETGVSDDYQFHSALPDGQLCSFEYGSEDGLQRRYVYLGFDVGPVTIDSGSKESNTTSHKTIELLIHDKGIDPDTGRGLWGALMGPFRMMKL